MKTLAIVSGKGGTGKTTISLNLSLALIKYGRQIITVDGNFETPHIGLMLGSSSFEDNIFHAIEEDRNLTEIVYKHQSGLKIIPGNISLEKLHKKDFTKFKEKIKELSNFAELVIVDTDSSFMHDNITFLRGINDIIIVTTPDLLSVTENIKLLKILTSGEKHPKILGVIVNKKTNKDYDMTIENIEELLKQKVIGIIPEHDSIKYSQKLKFPVLYSHPDSKASISYEKIACNLIGQKYKDDTQDKPKTKMEKVMEKVGLKKWYETLVEESED